MKEIPIEKGSYQKLEAAAKERGLTPDQYASQIVIEHVRETEEKTKEKMTKLKLPKHLWIPQALYQALLNAAREKHQTLKEYTDNLAIYLLYGEFDDTRTR